MTQHLLEALVQQVSKAVSELRTTLELNQLDDLERILNQTSAALESINGYAGGATSGGGVEKLKADILALDPSTSKQLMGMLDQASIDHKVNGELINLAMQRSAAMQSFMAQQSLGATYESSGGIPGSIGGVLSKKVW